MFDIRLFLLLIPALPLAAAVATAVLGPRVLRERSHVLVVTAVALSFAASVLLVFQMRSAIGTNGDVAEWTVPLWTWCDVPLAMPHAAAGDPTTAFSNFHIDIALRADPLSAVMLATVTCISLLVAIYSIGYLRGDPGYWRFFAYVALFVFSMTMLVLAGNFLLLYVFWESVGLCSYLLIGFWYERPAAAAAGKKAFLVNRVGDFGFALGIFLIWTTFGTLDFSEVFTAAEPMKGHWPATAVCLLLMAGACGKSAQFPLHVWLPDAMEGPTPVSALIHAATMVTAGVYMIARCMPLFAASPDALCVVAVVGGITALLGAIIALTQTDLKRILAYSTISHLGYMFMALGAGTWLGVSAGMFHLVTHAFFKALLFLGAGSVMHAMGGVIDIHRLGGLRRRMPVTYGTFLIGCLAIAGVWPLSGFFSKDAILLALLDRSGATGAGVCYEMLFFSALGGIVMIDFYMFRPFFMVFHGPERIPPEAGAHAHESSRSMTIPLMILAMGSLAVGAYFEWTHVFARFLEETPSLKTWSTAAPGCVESLATAVGGRSPGWNGGESLWITAERIPLVSAVITLLGIALAALLYLGRREKAARLARLMNMVGLYSLSYGKFFFDPIYQLFIVRPMLGIAWLSGWFDRCVIDALVDCCGALPKFLGAALRPLQNGMVQFYALGMIVGLLVMIFGMLM